jgi:hypothetical protein
MCERYNLGSLTKIVFFFHTVTNTNVMEAWICRPLLMEGLEIKYGFKTIVYIIFLISYSGEYRITSWR